MPQLPHVVLAAPLVIALCACSSDESAPVEEPGREVTETAGRAAPPVDLEPVSAKETRSGLGADALGGPGDPFSGIERPPIELTREDPLTGRIRPDRPIRSGECAEVVVEALMPGDASFPGGPPDADSVLIEWFPWREATRAPVRPDLTFTAPRPVGATHLRIRVEGDHLFGAGEAWTPGPEDLPRSPVEVPALVGARVLVRFDLPQDATAAEAAALVGRELGVTEGPSWFRGGSGAGRRFPFQLDEEVSGTVRGLPPGEWRIDRASSLGPHEQEGQRSLAPFCVRPGFTFDVEAGATAEITVPTIRGRRLACRVVDAAGRPVVGATARIVNRYSSGRMSGTRSTHCRTDDDGRFVAPALIDVPDSIIVEAEGFPPRRLQRGDAAALLDTEDATIVMDAGAALRLSVLTPEGLPAAGVPVTVIAARAKGEAIELTTDERGRALFHPLPAGSVLVTAAAVAGPAEGVGPGSSDGAAHFRAPAGPVTAASDPMLWCLHEELGADGLDDEEQSFTLRPAPTLSGRVTAISADWPDPVLVVVRPIDGQRPALFRDAMPFRNEGLEVDRASGSFAGQVAPGRHEVFATAGADAGARVQRSDTGLRSTGPIEIDVSEEDLQIELAFRGSAPIVGRVERPDGSAVVGIDVHLTARGFGRWPPPTPALTDASGRFEFAPVRPGRYIAFIRDEEFSMVERVEFDVESSRATPEVTIVAVPAGAARITVIGPDGATREGARLTLYGPGGDIVHVERLEGGSDWTGAHAPLAPGRYLAAAHAGQSAPRGAVEFDPGPAPLSTRRSTPLVHTAGFVVEAGEMSTVTIQERDEPAATVTGLVLSGGEPVRRILVALHRGPARITTVETDEDGRFEVATTFTGPAAIAIGGPVDHAAATAQLDLIDGPNPLAPIELPTGRVLGRVPPDVLTSATAIPNPAAFSADGSRALRYSGGLTGEYFEIGYLPDGDYVIGLPLRDGGLEGGVRVTIEDGETVSDVVL